MNNSNRKVITIQTSAPLPHLSYTAEYHKRRVAAYARVSTDSEEQSSSYESQVDFYTQQIHDNPEWEFVSVYTDEGISGTNTKKRDGFNRMIADALDGKIDLILTKSISRFARNTVDTLTTVRQLKKMGVEVFFEKENIYTLDAKGEVLITIMSSLAQEESRNISENISWGKKRSMEDGKVSLPYKHFLGYKKGKNDLPEIVEEEAKIIREIYSLFLSGKTIRTIAQHLMDQDIPTPTGRKNWSVSTIVSILSNEKYKGAALLQKTYTVDFLSKTVKKNEGEMKQYYIEDSHPAIIDPETFDLVQNELKKRSPNRRRLNNNSPFTAKIICSECGGYYGSKVWHSTSKYRSVLWQCNRKYSDEKICESPNIREDELIQAFIKAFNQILGDKNRYIENFQEILPLINDASFIYTKKLQELQQEHDAMSAKIHQYMEDNAHEIRDQVEYNRNFNEMSKQRLSLEAQIAKVKEQILEQGARKEKIRRFLDDLRQMGDIVTEFNEELWYTTIEHVTVSPDKTLTFLFQDGTEIPIKAI